MNKLSITLTSASGVPFYRQIVDQVAQFIRSGQLQPTTQLPSVRELASQLLVSLITVRRSYADLEASGLIVRRQGYGTFVAKEIKVASKEQSVAEARASLSQAICMKIATMNPAFKIMNSRIRDHRSAPSNWKKSTR